MRAPTPDVQEAFQRIAARPEGQLLRDYLQRCMADAQVAIAQEHDVTVVRMTQGHLQLLGRLLGYWKP